MEIRVTGEIPAEFRNSEDQLPIFTQPGYARFIRSIPSRSYFWAHAPGHGLLMPFMTSRRWGITSLRILFPAWSPDESKPDLTKAFLNGFVQLVRERNLADFIAQSPEISVFDNCPDGATFVAFGTYITDLRLSEEALFSAVTRSHRNQIRKAKNAGVTIRHGTGLLREAHEIIGHTHRKAGHAPLDIREFERYVEYLPGNSTFFVSYDGDHPQSAVFFLYSPYSSFALMAGSLDKTVPGNNNLLHWEAMLHFKGQGVRSYDLVGSRIDPPRDSKYHGLNVFKRKFGGRLKRGYLWRYPLNCKYPVVKFLADRLAPVSGRFSMHDIIDQELGRAGGTPPEPRDGTGEEREENE